MSALRTKDLDPDNRRTGRGDRVCCRCNRELKGSARWVHVIGGGFRVLHPDDEARYQPDDDDMGAQPIGMDCAKALGMEWSRP